MLKLKDIVKSYKIGDQKVEALRGVSMEFRPSEFVSILGPSGCGKTTMLNIIGGLDRYDSGDLEINGISTKKFKDKDWDSYRNHSIGFVFQSYNLISHQSVLSNVELALTISGVSKAERRRRAIEVLKKVGLGDQIKKKPNQLSGGQMQRVAIARALINNPEILLADEPTGALDSETSVQVMDLLKEIAKDKLVIMVTHNPELAEQYSSRIIRVLDGCVISDSNPYNGQEEKTEEKAEAKGKKKKVGMNFFTALSLSLNNLMTKKARTLMTAFAGSIGIIGIALIMSVSNGFQLYINKVQEDTLSTYPIQIDAEVVDMTNMLTSMTGQNLDDKERESGYIYARGSMIDMVNTITQQVKLNDLEAFKDHIESNSDIEKYANAVRYQYSTDLHIYATDTSGGALQLNPTDIMDRVYGSDMSATMTAMSSMGSMSAMMQTWDELIDNQPLLDSQYDVVAGRWPEAYNEVVLVANEGGVINEMALYTLGIKDISELDNLMIRAANGEELSSSDVKLSYEEALNLSYKLVINTDYYTDENGDGIWEDRSGDVVYMKRLVDNAIEIRVVGIVMPSDEAVSTSINGAIGYTHGLTEYVVNEINDSKIVKQQKANPEIDVFTGLAFDFEETSQAPETGTMTAYPQASGSDMDAAMMSGADMSGYGDMSTYPAGDMSGMSTVDISTLTEEEIALYTQYMMAAVSKNTYEDNMELFGVSDLESPSSIFIYPKDFDSKEALMDIIDEYNASVEEADKIVYTDYIGIMISGMSTIIDTISYVLIAFVSISLIVSSIMIGVITYISVLERTKEIGVLRAMGASKKDISRVFNAETLIIGFVAGAIGILSTLLLCIPINIIINSLANIGEVAKLPIAGGIGLIVISMLLTVIAGLIPSRVAAKKDPVEALRTE